MEITKNLVVLSELCDDAEKKLNPKKPAEELARTNLN